MTIPSIVEVDETGWPILVLTFGGELTLADVDVYTSALERALERGDAFGTAMVVAPAYLASGRNNEVANKNMKWLKEHKPRLSDQCVGITTVIADDAQRTAYAQIAEQQGEKVYGCPLRTFATIALAHEWLHERLAGTRNTVAEDAPPLDAHSANEPTREVRN